LPAVSSWFSENSDATIVVAKSKKDRKRELEVHGRKAELIVIGGGDGTISKALPQLLKLGKPFAVLPLGTANDFARTIELPMDPMQAAEVALTGRKHRIDVGLANGHRGTAHNPAELTDKAGAGFGRRLFSKVSFVVQAEMLKSCRNVQIVP
jgi:diacylglycerol kinase family enzyme